MKSVRDIQLACFYTRSPQPFENSFNRLARADPDDELASVLPKLNPLNPVVTVWRDGRLLGVVPPSAIKQQMQRLVGARI